MDAVYSSGVLFAEMLQTGPPWLERIWLWVTYVADPQCIFVVFFPLAYFLDRKVGVAVLWIGLVSEWLNVVAKWRRTPCTAPGSRLTGPRNPCARDVITNEIQESVFMLLTPFMVYLLLLLAVGVSRIFILAHFPHQVLGGPGGSMWTPARGPAESLKGGLAGSPGLSRPDTLRAETAGLLFGKSFQVLTFLHRSSRSIHLATKWCLNPEWIRVETRPFASLSRDAASALGLGLATHSSLYIQLRHERPGWKQRAVGAGLALAALQGLKDVMQPENIILWYSLNFLKYASFPWLVVALVPWLVRSLPLPQSRPHAE
uniref:Glucose-6-phosphatase catalytic subunit 3 n=1 Tax=Chelydra serpentina TaxID=8475 RepID=A0A8C3SR30_CHESE